MSSRSDDEPGTEPPDAAAPTLDVPPVLGSDATIAEAPPPATAPVQASAPPFPEVPPVLGDDQTIAEPSDGALLGGVPLEDPDDGAQRDDPVPSEAEDGWAPSDAWEPPDPSAPPGAWEPEGWEPPPPSEPPAAVAAEAPSTTDPTPPPREDVPIFEPIFEPLVRPSRPPEATGPLAPVLGDDESILDDLIPAARANVLSAPMEAFADSGSEPPSIGPPSLGPDASVEYASFSEAPSGISAPPSIVETIDLEVPDDDDDEPGEPSSFIGEIPWQEEGRAVRVAIAGGKGGVGRTLLAANVGLFLARMGRAVVLADLDPGGGNLHTYLGLDPVVPAIGDALRRGSGPRIDRVEGVSLRLCRARRPQAHGPDDSLRREVLGAARELDADVVILDLGNQVDPMTVEAFLGADLQIVVTLPDRASVERAYGFMRVALDHRLLEGDDRPALLARALLAADDRSQLASPKDLVSALAGVEPQAAEAIRARLLAFAPGLVINRCRTRAERDLVGGMVNALRRRWGISPTVLAAIDNDDAVTDAARRRRPLVLEYPGSTVSGHVERLARRIFNRVPGREVRR